MNAAGDAFQAFGLLCDNPVADDELHRCATARKPRKMNGWYVLFDSGQAGIFGNWEEGDGYRYWRADGGTDFRPSDRDRIERLKERRAKEQEETAEASAEYFEECAREGYSDYLKRKRLYPHGARFDAGTLVIPLQDAEGRVWSVQKITASGDKFFMTGGKVRGCFFKLFPDRNVSKDEMIVVCEGFATGASIHQATGLPVIVAFNAGNLKVVTETVPFRNLIIAADNDESGVGEAAAKETGYPYVMPDHPGWDFSDVFLNGKDVKAYFARPQYAAGECVRVGGLVQEIADWITATATRPQPLLSLSAAITFMGMVKGHRVRGATNLRTNVMFLSLGPSSAGKDYPSYAVGSLTDACGLGKHLMGTPTSGAGLLTGLNKADGVSLLKIDEMGRFLGNISLKSAGGYQREITDYMVELFSSAGRTFRGKQYADEKANPQQLIHQPHFCCLGSTVPERLQMAFSSAEMIDGFLNRWLVSLVSERPEKRCSVDFGIPPSTLVARITDWMNSNPVETDTYGVPIPKEVRFTPEAWDMLAGFEAESMKKLDTEPYPINQLYARNAEHAEKLAMILADGDWIGIAETASAISIVRQSNVNIAKFAGKISDNQYEADLLEVESVIRNAKSIARNHLTRATRKINNRTRQEILAQLIDADQIVQEKHGKKVTYRYVR